MQVPTTPALDENESGIRISMSDDLVVIRPPDPVDVEITRVLVDAAASAVTAGAAVMVDLDRGPTDDLLWFKPRRDDSTSLADETPAATVLGPGWVRLSTRDAYWTIDLAKGRLSRADTLVDPHFVAEHDWTRIRALWVTCTHVTALTDDGTYVSTRTSWASSNPPRLSIPA
ncbi:hypothetical protein [Ilumatobacter sp.]|uniref:hypothetical protein n=1 Tax=Ilumatobacter sp. TaxID=1967498 RepID=UPI003C675EFA